MRMMAVFEKSADLRYVGHLDLMRAVQRALRRSGLPIKYSKGFNPHIRLSFAAPLSVGVIGLRELMEVPVEDGLTEEAFQTKLNAVLPACLQIRACRAIGEDFPTLMSLVAGARYTLRFASTAEGEKALSALPAFMALKEYVANRRTKSGENPCDIRPFVKSAESGADDRGLWIRLETIQTKAGALKPSLWVNCLCEFAGLEPLDCLIYRDEVLARNSQGKLIPMEAFAHE